MNHFRILILAMFTLIAACAWASSNMVRVAPPNGTDDTANIQNALEQCVARGPGCTIQLAAGTYRTKQIVAYNFRGTFKGAGMNRTIIEDIPLLSVTTDPSQQCQPNTTTCLWQDLIIFVDGDFTVSDLSIHIVAGPGEGTLPWPGIGMTVIWDAVRVMGQHATNATFDRISIEGRQDATTWWGYNLGNGILYSGELPRTPTYLDNYFLSGSLTVRNSFFKHSLNGVAQDGFTTAAHVTIGGSPGAGNHFEDTDCGFTLSSSQKSTFDVSYNESSGNWFGMLVQPWFPESFVPTSRSRYLIHDNKFVGNGYYATGIGLSDTASHQWLDAVLWNNDIQLQYPLSFGIDVNYARNAMILNNTVTGSGFEGIGLWNVTRSTVIGNNVSNFALEPSGGLGQIYLNPGTSQDLVVCSGATDTVVDLGTNNVVVGCQK